MHAIGHVERMQTLLAEPYGEPFDGRFMAEWRKGVRRGVLGLGRILPERAVHLEQLFGSGVARLQVVIAEWPCRRDPVVMGHFLEVAAAEARQAGAIHLGIAPDPVVDPWLERLPGLGVIPGLGGDVALLEEHMVRLAVLRLPGQELAALDNQHIQAGVLQRPSESAAPHAGADDHDIRGQRVLIGVDERTVAERRRWWSLIHIEFSAAVELSKASTSLRSGIAARSPRRVVASAPTAAP